MAGDADQLAEDLAAVAARLREIGDGGLARELTAAIGRAVEPVPEQVRKGLKPHLPDRYAEVLDADLRIGRTTSTSGQTARARVYATTRGVGGVKRRRLRRLDDGVLWHPLFGNRKRGDYQEVEPGWFTGVVEDAVPRVRDEIDRALNDVAARAAGKGA